MLLAAHQASAVPTNFSFTGTFAQDDDVQLFNFTADGSSTVTLRSYSYAGGTQANGNVVAAGGFDPILALFDATGAFIAQQDDDTNDNGICDGNSDPNTGRCWDTFFNQLLTAGSYTVSIMQFDNFANGPNLSNGFDRQGQGNFTGSFGGCSNGSFCDVSGVDPFNNRTNAWAFDILNSASPVPEPATLTSLGLGLAVLLMTRRRYRKPGSNSHDLTC
jgi:hypothetical protein